LLYWRDSALFIRLYSSLLLSEVSPQSAQPRFEPKTSLYGTYYFIISTSETTMYTHPNELRCKPNELRHIPMSYGAPLWATPHPHIHMAYTLQANELYTTKPDGLRFPLYFESLINKAAKNFRLTITKFWEWWHIFI
jgi:hypothetical protein